MQSVDQIQWPGWDVVRLIGRGGFGAVYEIKRDLFGEEEHAALKVITIPESEDVIDDLRLSGATAESITLRFNDYLANIVKEYSTMAKMRNHPNVVYCEDAKYIQHDDGIGYDIFIKMELLTPLKKRMDLVKNEQGVIDLGIAICNALVQCNQLGIIHRDIKPENIFVTQFGDFKLGDFGIARTMERTTQATKTGSYPYMAPEVYNNQKYGASVDQYSLGIVLYRLLNDYRLPFCPPNTTQSQDNEARKRRFDGEQIPPPAHGSKQLQAIVLRACAYDPKDRFASAAEMLAALKALKNGSASPAVAVPMGTAAAVAGGAAAGVAADEMTTGTVGTVGRRRPNTEEEATVGAFGAGAAYASRQQGQSSTNQNAGQQNGGPGRVQPAQQGNRQYAGASAIPPQSNKEEKKKRGIGAWLAIAAGLVVVIGGVLLLALGKKIDSGNQSDTRSAINNHTSESTATPGEALPVQLDWAEWADELPDYVTGNDYTIEERTLYRSRNLETTSSTTSDKLDGWELYDSATGDGDYGPWSDWSEEEALASDTREIEQKIHYRYRDKETTTSNTNTKEGWTLEDTTYSWSDYGAWSQWALDKVAGSDSRDVESKKQYRYRDKETTTANYATKSGWERYDEKTTYGNWSSWSSWATNAISKTDTCDVEQKTQYRYREKQFTTSESSSLGGWTCYNSTEAYGSWSSWSDTYIAPTSYLEVKTQTVVDVPEHTEYRYGAYYGSGGTWCCRYDTTAHNGYTPIYTSWSASRVSPLDLKATCGYYHTSAHPHDHYAGQLNAGGYNHAYYKDFWYQYVINGTKYYWEESKVVPATYKTQYKYRNIYHTYYYWKWGDWSDYSDSQIAGNDNREVSTRVIYRSRNRSQNTTYYFYRWKDWSSWSTTQVSESGNRKVETRVLYRFRDRASIPTYHFSRWKEWSDWSTKEIQAQENREVEESTLYRFREKATETTYYFRRWTDWSDYTESPVDESDTVEVDTKTQYRYKSKES